MTAPTPEQIARMASALYREDAGEGDEFWSQLPESARHGWEQRASRLMALLAPTEQWYVVADRRRGDPADETWICEGDRVTYGAVNSTGELVIDLIERPVEPWYVVKDRARGDNPQYDDIEDGDRVLYISGSKFDAARVDRIERKASDD